MTKQTQPSSLIDPNEQIEKVADGFAWTEGPAWISRRGVLRFSDIPNNRVVEYKESTGEVVVIDAAADFTNGRTVSPDGSVVECSHGKRAIQVDRNAQNNNVHEVETLVDAYGGLRLNSPNDVVVKSDGTIWFTDPSYGIMRPTEGYAGREEYGDRYVFRFDPASGDLSPVVIDVEAPNGLAFSPDESTLYVSDSSIDPPDRAHPNPARPGGHSIHAYDIFEGRTAKNGRMFAEITPGLPDGFRVDTRGNVWTSSLSGIQILDSAGTKITEIPIPEKVANCCFGGADGSTLYICASTSIYRMKTNAEDARTAYHHRTALSPSG